MHALAMHGPGFPGFTSPCEGLYAGLANPGPVAAALWTDAELESSICLDAVVTVVDAKNILRQLADQPGSASEVQPGAKVAVNEAAQQLAFADVVLLNKVRRETRVAPVHLRTPVFCKLTKATVTC